jgi:osmotically inducible protein OsmC
VTQTPEKILYTAVATSTGGRRGHVSSSDGNLEAALTAPKETGGPGTGTNPEQLFAAGYSACFNSALSMTAKKIGVDAKGSRVTAEVGFGPVAGSYGLTVELLVSIPDASLEQIREAAEAAHGVCPYSRAISGNVPVTLTPIAV